MSEFPECMEHRNDSGAESGRNGQVCHRIAHHDGHHLFDRAPEFDPVREEARPLPTRGLHIVYPVARGDSPLRRMP